MRQVFIASPLAGDREANVAYARLCMADSFKRGEAPFAPHLLYPQVLDDDSPIDRQRGMDAGKRWLWRSEALVVYMDLGISTGMTSEIEEAHRRRIPIEHRYLYTDKEST